MFKFHSLQNVPASALTERACFEVLETITLYCTVQYCTVLYCTVLYFTNTVLYCTVQILYSTVLELITGNFKAN